MHNVTTGFHRKKQITFEPHELISQFRSVIENRQYRISEILSVEKLIHPRGLNNHKHITLAVNQCLVPSPLEQGSQTVDRGPHLARGFILHNL